MRGWLGKHLRTYSVQYYITYAVNLPIPVWGEAAPRRRLGRAEPTPLLGPVCSSRSEIGRSNLSNSFDLSRGSSVCLKKSLHVLDSEGSPPLLPTRDRDSINYLGAPVPREAILSPGLVTITTRRHLNPVVTPRCPVAISQNYAGRYLAIPCYFFYLLRKCDRSQCTPGSGTRHWKPNPPGFFPVL